jgi:hypothetical protein
MMQGLKHKVAKLHLQVRPKVVCCNKPAKLTISALSDHARFLPGETIYVAVYPMHERPFELNDEPDTYPPFPVTASEDGTLSFTVNCNREQEYSLRLLYKKDGVDELQKLCTLSIFAAEEDLYARRPYKGDTHVHTVGSDGRESPGAVAATYRRAGFDFLAITDHGTYEPSLEAIERMEGIPSDLSLFPGEEVHIPEGSHIHAVNFGSSLRVNQYYRDNKEEVDKEVLKIMEELDDACPDKREYAYRVWIARRIQQGGGLAIFVHPHWVTQDFYSIADDITEYAFIRGDYDAFELLNGMDIFSNNMQTAFYFDQRAKGRNIPIVGASDSHGTWEPGRHFEDLYTYVFAHDRTLEGIKESVKSYYSVAIEEYRGEHFRIYGDYRMVRYAIFLAKEYFPLYKKLCAEQGESLLRYLQGHKEELPLLQLLEGRTDRFADEFFGRNA